MCSSESAERPNKDERKGDSRVRLSVFFKFPYASNVGKNTTNPTCVTVNMQEYTNPSLIDLFPLEINPACVKGSGLAFICCGGGSSGGFSLQTLTGS